MKRAIKRFSRSSRGHDVLSWLAAGYVRLVLMTSRRKKQLAEQSLPFLNGEKQVIFASWHNRALLVHHLMPTNPPLYALASAHSDGRLIGRLLMRFGFGNIYGSTAKGGDKALREMIRSLKAGHNLAISPDGPRGPAEQVSEGIVRLAMMTQTPVVPIAYSASRARRLRSWDRFMIAFPFSRLYFASGDPIYWTEGGETDKKQQREALSQRIEDALNNITRQADQLADSRHR